MSVVERFFARGHCANKVSPRLVVGKVSPQELRISELFLAGLVAALKGLCASLGLHRTSVFSFKAHFGLQGIERGLKRVAGRITVRVFLLHFSDSCLSATAQKTDSLLSRLLNHTSAIH